MNEADPALKSLPTEARNPRTVHIDELSTAEIVALINDEDLLVAPLVTAALPDITRAVDLVVARIRAGGRVHYFGAGTSARIAVMDAAELIPTYGIDPDLVTVHQAGGASAQSAAVEGAEDDIQQGHRDAATLTSSDVAIGLTASGRTPYVAATLRHAASLGTRTVLITSNPAATLATTCDVAIAVDTGPEVIAGSTRMKAGTAQKLILNCLSTAVMIKLGRTYSNLMVTVAQTNGKLVDRAARILAGATGLRIGPARVRLAAAEGNLPRALVMTLRGTSPQISDELLRLAHGSVRQALLIDPDQHWLPSVADGAQPEPHRKR